MAQLFFSSLLLNMLNSNEYYNKDMIFHQFHHVILFHCHSTGFILHGFTLSVTTNRTIQCNHHSNRAKTTSKAVTVCPQYFDSFIVPFYPSIFVFSDSPPNKCSVITTLSVLIETFFSCFDFHHFFIIQFVHAKYMLPVITSLLAY